MIIAGLLVGGIAGCAVGPNYQRPNVPTPVAYKEAGLGVWKESSPQDQIAKGSWWEVFGDRALNKLEQQATANNQALKAAVARVTQARATARVAKAEFFPNFQAEPSATRQRTPATLPNPFPNNNFNDFRVPLDFSYELDIWGRVRRSFEAANDEAKASVAGYETVLLTLKAEVAQDYFALRALDAERAILRDTVELRKEALQLIRARYTGGAASELDLSRAETELSTAESEYVGLGNAANLKRSRAAYEEAVAQYRQRVLVAFQEVENGLSGLRILAEQEATQARSVAAATRTAEISGKRYQAGLVSYLEVVDSDRTKLQVQRGAIQILGQRLITSVQLVKALGGGWLDSSLRASAK